MRNQLCSAIAVALALAAAPAAQEMKTKSKVEGKGYQDTKTKSEMEIKIKDGKDVTVVGCLQRSADGRGLVLSNLSGDSVKTANYQLIADNDDMSDLEKHLGHKIEIEGKAADQKDGEIEIKSKTETEVEGQDDKKTEVKTKIEGDLIGLPFLGVKSVKMISNVCP